MATIVYKKPNPDGHTGTLFEGHSFWLSASVPQRNRFKELIQINGGTIKLLERDADIKLVDHAKRDIPLNSHSYKFVEKSIQNGQLEDLEDHRAGQHNRPVGAAGIPARGSRISYTLEDDQILWDWMQPYEKRKDSIAGNLIYQQLASQYPRHTFQSWRDRYLKRIKPQGFRPGGPAQATEPPSPEQTSSQKYSSQRTSLSKGETSQVSSTIKKSNSHHSSATRTVQSGAPHTPDLAERRTVPKPNGNAGNDRTTNSTGPLQNTTAAKRKRTSYEDTSAVSSAEVDHASKRKRRATDSMSQSNTSTPAHNYDVPASGVVSDSQPATSDESQSTKFETAPQFPDSADTQTQHVLQTPSQLEEDENLKVLKDLPDLPSSTTGPNATQDIIEGEGIEEWVQKRIDDGHSSEHVLFALGCTSMNADRADKVLDCLTSGKGIPNMPGVWTEEDDKDVFSADGRVIARLNEKHGKELYNERYKHLNGIAEANRLLAQEGV